MDNFDLDEAIHMVDSDSDFEYDGDVADDDFEYDSMEALTDDDDLDMDAASDDSYGDDYDFEEDDDYDMDVDEALYDAADADVFGDEDQHADLIGGGIALARMIRRRKKKKQRKERSRQLRLKRLMKRPSRNYKTALANRRSISAVRSMALKNRAGVRANRTTTARLKKVAATNSGRINKTAIAASRANTVNKAQSRRLRQLRKIQRTDGALDLSRSVVLQRTDAGLGIGVNVTDALKGAVKHGWLGRGRGVLGNSAVIGAAAFLADNLTTVFPQTVRATAPNPALGTTVVATAPTNIL